MTIDLSPWRDPADLIDAIWQSRRADRRDLLPDLVRLLEHENANVREEVVSLLFVKWKEQTLRARLLQLLQSDSDFGVRSRAAGALALSSTEDTRTADVDALRTIVLDRQDDPIVRKAAYEALYRVMNDKPLTLDDDIDIDEDVDLGWVGQL